MTTYNPSIFPAWGGPVFAAAVQVAVFLAKVLLLLFFFNLGPGGPYPASDTTSS
jgi:hypothetical protein